MTDAVLLIAHGTVDDLKDLPSFLANIRRGHPAPPDLVAEMRPALRAIGGRSPLNAINQRVAKKLEARLGIPVRACNRLWTPRPHDALAELASHGATKVAVVPLAQYSTHLYAETVQKAEEARAGEGGTSSGSPSPATGVTCPSSRAPSSPASAAPWSASPMPAARRSC